MSSQTPLTATPTSLEPVPTLDGDKKISHSRVRSFLRLTFFVFFLAALFLPFRYPGYFDPAYRLPQFNRFMALALFALSVDMIWGYTGLLSLGQGLYFGVGAYIVAWSLKLQQACMAASDADPPTLDRYNLQPGIMPDYMEQCRLPAVPDWIAPLINIRLAIVLAIVVPTVLAFLFGYVVFRRASRGSIFPSSRRPWSWPFFTGSPTSVPIPAALTGRPTWQAWICSASTSKTADACFTW